VSEKKVKLRTGKEEKGGETVESKIKRSLLSKKGESALFIFHEASEGVEYLRENEVLRRTVLLLSKILERGIDELKKFALEFESFFAGLGAESGFGGGFV
jgi:hypothetical protein